MGRVPRIWGRVENRRSGCGLPVGVCGWAFAWLPQSDLAWLCFPFPLIEPDSTLVDLEHAKAGAAGTAARRSTSSQFFTYFYPHLTLALFGSSMFRAGLIQVAARIRSSS